VAGTTYHIAVDGYHGSMGNIVLSWSAGSSAALVAGDFHFTSASYIASERDSGGVISANPRMASVSPRLTITRTAGATGRVRVDYVVTNAIYVDYTAWEVFGTNITASDDSGNTTNSSVTITNVQNFYENNEAGQFVYIPINSYTIAYQSNVNGQVTGSLTNGFNVGSNLPPVFCRNLTTTQVITSTNSTSGSTSTLTLTTNYFCTNWITTNFTPAAIAGLDYTATNGPVFFDDYQMSADVYLTVNQNVSFNPAPIIRNRTVMIAVTNVSLDPLESPLIAPPTMNSGLTTASLDILATTVIPGFGASSIVAVGPGILLPVDRTPGVGTEGTNILNLERATIRCHRNVVTAQIYGIRNSLDYSGSCSVPYRLDYYPRVDDSYNFFQQQAGSDYAGPGDASWNDVARWFSGPPDFVSVTGTLSWGANDPDPKAINIPITNYDRVDFNKDIYIELYYPPGNLPTDHIIGNVGTAVMTILFDDIGGDAQPAGAIDRTYNPDNNANTDPPYNLTPGANGKVYAIAIQPSDGRAVLGGGFTAYNSNPSLRNHVVRVNTDGSFDTTFDPKDGADDFVSAVTVDGIGNIVVGGAFTSFNRIPRAGIARLLSTGALDTGFFPGQGANGVIRALAVQNSTNILVAGDFNLFNGTNRNFIARLNGNGSLDPTFDPGDGPDDIVRAVAIQSDGKVLIAGDFSYVDGVSRNSVARLNTDGSLDTTFDPGDGADGPVYALVLQPDGRVLIGGDFSNVADVPRSRIGRLNADGSLDATFDPGAGADDTIYSLAVQPDGNIIAGGIFTSFDQTRRVGLTRVFPNGMLDTSFMDTAYNQFAGLINHYWNPDLQPHNLIYASAVQNNSNILVAGSFTRVGGGFTRSDVRAAQNFTSVIGGSTPGPGNIGLSAGAYAADQISQRAFITMSRDNGHLGPAAVSIAPTTLPSGPGAAVDGTDFTFQSGTYGRPVWVTSYSSPTWHVADGIFGQNNGGSLLVDGSSRAYPQNDVYISILDNTNAAGNLSFNLALSNPGDNDQFLLGGEKIPLGVGLGLRQASFTIINDQTKPGVLGFSSPTYTIAEAKTNALITVTRTGGSDGAVTVQYATASGTAVAATNYNAVSGRLTFNPGEVTKTFKVPILDDSVVGYNRTVLLSLFTPSGGATLGLTNAVLTIVDSDLAGGFVQFTSPIFGINEDGGFALVNVTRSGSSAGTLSVQFAATNGTAVANTNYLPLTTNLVWNNGDAQPKVLAIPVLDDGVVETNNLTVNLQLSNPLLNSAADPKALGIGTTNILATNAVLYITNRDFIGQLSFSAGAYQVNENGGYAIISVIRTGGSAGPISVQFATADDTAVSGLNYLGTNGTLSFGPGEVSKSFTVPLLDDGFADASPFFFKVSLSNPNPAGTLSSQTTASVYILDAEGVAQPPGGLDPNLGAFGVNGDVHALALQADGKLLAGGDFTAANGLARNRLARWNTDASLDEKFSSISPSAGPNGSVLALACQTDQRIVVGGQFTQVNSVNRNYLARLNLDGSLDSSFNPGSGPDNSVFAVAETFVGTARKLLIGGAFLNFNSTPRSTIARINDDGSLDTTFNTGAGANGSVFAIALQPDGKAIIGGDFTAVNGFVRNHIARLYADGSLDLGFDPGVGPSDSVRAIAVQLDGNILIGGLFTQVGTNQLNHIARLTNRGQVDKGFTPGLGANDVVSAIALEPDTRIVLGGQFTLCNGVTRGRLTRLNPDGTVDTMIDFGTGADSFISGVVIQSDGMIVFGGDFSHYDGQSAGRLARIFGGTVAGSGAFEFTTAGYSVTEDATNATVTVRRTGGTSGVLSNGVYVPNVSVTLSTSNGTAIAGVNYLPVVTNLVFPPGEVSRSVLIPVMRDYAITPDLTINLALTNPLPAVAGGPVLGNQPIATLTNINVDSAVSFSAATYSTPENPLTGVAFIPVLRAGSTVGAASVDFYTATNGTALATTNYGPITNTITFAPGQSSNVVEIPIIPTLGIAEGDKTVVLELTNAINTLLFSPAEAVLTIVDVDHAPGQLLFGQTNYVISAAAGQTNGSVILTVLRTNGHTGSITVNYATAPGTATAGLNFTTTTGTLTFADGEVAKTISVPILDAGLVDPGGFCTFTVTLSSPGGGATFGGPSTASVVILDDHIGVALSSPIYIATESDGTVTLAVNRVGTSGTTSVSYATIDGTALAGTNYVAVTNQTLVFANGEALKTFNVQLLHDPRVTGDLFFDVILYGASNNPPANVQIYANNPAVVTVKDADPGVSFTNASFGVLKSGTNIVLAVVRTNLSAGDVSVSYATTNGTAIAGIDYTNTSGQLTFSNGTVLLPITVPIINNREVGPDLTFNVVLFTNGLTTNLQLLPPSIATVTITNDVSGFQFSAPTYSVSEKGGFATFNVQRAGYTNSTVSVDFATTVGGTAKAWDGASGNYHATNGTLLFTNGVTNLTFTVGVIDDGVITNNHTVLLGLSNPTGNSVLLSQNQTVLTIVEADGTLVVPAGSALVSESGPVNGVIDAGERVTLLLALRDVAGFDATNVQATLLTNSAVTNISPTTPVSYGTLVSSGPSASRPFTFTANATNGQPITVALQLNYGTNSQQVSYSYVVGNQTTAYTNSQTIVINDDGPATNYPSVISVSGLGNVLTKATVTLTNLYHTWPSDIDILLVSPTLTNTYLMSKCGGGNSVSRVTLNFDDSAANLLPQSAQITNGYYRPTSYALASPPFPAPAPYSTAAGFYRTNLGTFNGSNPNGDWKLYVLDDTHFNQGAISNGWILNLTTAGMVPVASDLALGMIASTDNVVVTSNLTYTLFVTNYGPSSASGVWVTNALPGGLTLINSTPSVGSVSNVAGQILWNVGSLAKDAFASLTLLVEPQTIGTLTNIATVGTTNPADDPNPSDNSASVFTTVSSPTADLVVSVAGSPNPVLLGGDITYTVTVTNAGPATATALTIDNTLPAGTAFVSALPAYSLSGSDVLFSLGDLGAGTQTTVTIVCRPLVVGTLTDSATCNSTTTPKLKGHNTAAVKTIVETMQFSRSQSNLVFAWPADVGTFNLESTTDLTPPVVWTRVTTPLPQLAGGTNSVSIPIGNGQRMFFRLHGQ
jgi:uncharacterized delta-60 repeat protein/uncharacterized repeat protein (TIGR01451 family)